MEGRHFILKADTLQLSYCDHGCEGNDKADFILPKQAREH